MEGKFYFTEHAIMRYRERFRNKISMEQALKELIFLSSYAIYKKSFYEKGKVRHRYELKPPHKIQFIVNSDDNVVITVLIKEEKPKQKRRKKMYSPTERRKRQRDFLKKIL